MNDQRKAIFEQRLEFMTDDNVSDVIEDMRHEVCEGLVETHIPRKAYAEQWDIDGIKERTRELMLLDLPFDEWAKEEGIADEEMLTRMKEASDTAFEQISSIVDKPQMQNIEKQVLLQVIDKNWRDHLQQLDALKSVVGLRGYAQRDPLNEYKSEAFTLFDNLLGDLREGVTQELNSILINALRQNQQRQQMELEAAAAAPAKAPRSPQDMLSGASLDDHNQASGSVPDIDASLLKGMPRNAPCPCGSGRKIKHCHGQVRGKA
jgi:preprotein translocase subunit SecA